MLIDLQIVKHLEAHEVKRSVNVLVFGSVAVDFACNYAPGGESSKSAGAISTPKDSNLLSEQPKSASFISPQMHTSNLAAIETSLGGVGHNVALAIHRVGGLPTTVRLHSIIADDL